MKHQKTAFKNVILCIPRKRYKTTDGRPNAMIGLITDPKIEDIKYGIKLAEKNIGFKDNVYTFPYFLSFLIKRYLSEK